MKTPVTTRHSDRVCNGRLLRRSGVPATPGRRFLLGMLVWLAFVCPLSALSADAVSAYPGEKKDWNGFDRYSFECDGRQCTLTIPKTPAPGNPWVLRARFPDSLLGEQRLLASGYFIAYMDVVGMFANEKAMKHWDAFYGFLTGKYSLSKKVVLADVSRGSLNIHNWAALNTGKVACIVGVKPVCDIKSWPGGKGLSGGHAASWKQLLEAYGMTEEQALAYRKNPVDTVGILVKARIPILHIYSPQDEAVPYEENTRVMEERAKEAGGRIETIAVEIKKEPGDPRQAAVDKKNPKAVAGAHRKVDGAEHADAIVAFILKHTAGAE